MDIVEDVWPRVGLASLPFPSISPNIGLAMRMAFMTYFITAFHEADGLKIETWRLFGKLTPASINYSPLQTQESKALYFSKIMIVKGTNATLPQIWY